MSRTVASCAVTDDFSRAFRRGRNLFANNIVALDALTGERKWHYQIARPDTWDYGHWTGRKDSAECPI